MMTTQRKARFSIDTTEKAFWGFPRDNNKKKQQKPRRRKRNDDEIIREDLKEKLSPLLTIYP